MSYSPAPVVEVRAWHRLVGAVALDPATGFYAFEYDDGWLARGEDLAPLHMPRQPGAFEFPQLARETFYGLPAMLADALPDRFGHALVDAWMAENGISPDRITPLDRLAYASDRAMGALTFAPPAGRNSAEVTAVQLADLVTAARAQVTGQLDDAGAHDALQALISVGTSAGGARAKAVITYNPATGQMRSGQFGAPDGFEHWLIKLDGVGADPTREADPFTRGAAYGRIEYAYYLMATAAGVAMSESRLLPEGPRTHFMTRRFDRDANGGRFHMQSLCALAHLDFNIARVHSYSSYLQTINQLALGPDALNQAFRRVVFNVAAVNHDDHTKNLGFLLPEGGSWQLAPAFDVTHAHNPGGPWTHSHQMSVNGRFDGIRLDDLRVFGDRHGVPGIESAIGDVLTAVADWPAFAQQAGAPNDVLDKIASDIEDCRPT